MTASTAEEYWEGFYRERDKVWTGNPNPLLAREAAGLVPGSALDLGCGEGGDALWLAGRGWRVLAVDVAEVALRRGAAHAADAGVADRITWERHDLSRTFPEGAFDLVSAQFLHSPVAADGERDEILRRAAAAVAPGGTLLLAAHSTFPTWMTDPPKIHLPTNASQLEALALDPTEWTVLTAALIDRDLPGPEGQPGTRTDSLLRITRRK
ncbi:class I SAM-dependent methyltransferase [Nocardia puris]|uniref:Methyltransferase family protein n=1 Tax=Nocardia puris TaxID=208602 RepID=A0A366DCR4_9NOCA|nr:class I SAM-dependent methyltransferase [Nocardia puris]MBF6211163.1 class I SAM-dependent methyltransferase [Nocardia puris]MBF6364882.1 class I SAM-dependent methyltransferase [Nocardia puris]MBF6458668.1 class I SAM-dependent methyltransferase [Nocardia puris]RBO87833.1 methyltransferase family protein [Nocardia puris]